MAREFSHLTVVYYPTDKVDLTTKDIPFEEIENTLNLTLTNKIKQTTFEAIIVFLYDDVKNKYYSFDITSLIGEAPSIRETQNFQQELKTRIGNKRLPEQTFGNWETGEAYAIDTTYFDFKPIPAKIGISPTIPIPVDDRKDYLLTKEGVDYEHLANTSIVTVNGLAHRLYGEVGTGLYIKDGYQTCKRKEMLHIGLLNVEEMGARVHTWSLSADNRVNPVPDLKWTDGFYIRLKGKNFSRTPRGMFSPHILVGISLGGFIHFLEPNDKLLKRVSNDTFKVDMRYFNLDKRIWELDPLLPEGLRGLGVTEEGRPIIFKESLESDKFLDALLNLSQTFMFMIESEGAISLRYETVGRLTWPKRYWTKREFPHLPLRLGDGRIPSFSHIDERIGFTIHTIENLKPYYFDNLDQTKNLPFRTYYQRTTVRPEIQHAQFIRLSALKKGRKVDE